MKGSAPPVALTIAGSDSGGGAGIQADLKTFMALGCYGVTTLTAVTAQNTRGVTGIHSVPVAMVEQQLDALFDDFNIAALKTGMLVQPEVVEAVVAKLRHYEASNIVVDPVMVATSDDRLVSEETATLILEKLVPQATVVTPNLFEAQILSGVTIRSLDDMKRAAERISSATGTAVVVKGGHLDGDACFDVLLESDEFHIFEAPRYRTTNTHGTGCTFAAALAAGLAKGNDLAAVKRAQSFVNGAIKHSYDIGKGNGPVNHSYGLI